MPFDHERYEQLRMQLIDRNEANIENVYLDVLGIPTVGLGVALTARQTDRTMALDENHIEALASVLSLDPQQTQRLSGLLRNQLEVQNRHIDERHNNLREFLASDFGQESQRVLGPMVTTKHDSPSGSSWSWDVLTSAESPMQVRLTHEQSLHLFRKVAPEYEGRLNNALRKSDCPAEALSEEQRAAIFSMIYQGATGKAHRVANAIGDYWRGEMTENELRGRLRAVTYDPSFPDRSRNEFEFLENIKQRSFRETLGLNGVGKADEALLEQLRERVRVLDQQAGKNWDDNSERLAASALVMAKRIGFDERDNLSLAFNRPTERLRAGEILHLFRQGPTASPDPAENRIHMSTSEALSMPAEQRYQQAAAIGHALAGQQQAEVTLGRDGANRSGPRLAM